MMLNGFPVAISALVLATFSTLVVYARIHCRKLRGSLSSFDYVMILALLGVWGITGVNYSQVYIPPDPSGDNEDIVQDPKKVWDSLNGILLTWYIYRFTYPIALLLIKFSILLFYLRLAKSTQNAFRYAIYATMVLLFSYTICIVCVSIFACGQPSAGYTLQEPVREFEHRVTCLDVNAIWFAQSGFNLFTDVVILVLPMPTLLELHIPLHRRITLVAVFSVGSIAVAAACLRVWLISEWSKSFEAQARYGYIMLIGGQIELNAGIVSACIPFLKPLLRWFENSGNRKF